MVRNESEPGEESESPLTTVIAGGILVSMGKFVALLLSFFTQIVMARLLTQAAYGRVVLTLAIVNFLGIIALLGVDDGVMRQYPQYEDNPTKARGIIRASFGISLVSGFVAGISLFLAAPMIATLAFNDTSLEILIRIAAVSVPFITVRSVAVALARGARDARTHTYVDQLAEPILRFLLIAGLIFSGFGAVGAVSGQATAYVVSGILALLLLRRILPWFNQPSVSMYRTVLAFSLPLVAVEGMNAFVSQMDIYILGYFRPSSTVGVYNIALQLSNLFYPLLISLSFLLPPVLTRLHKQGEGEEMRQIYQLITKWIVIFGIPLLVLFIFAPELVISSLFGVDYTEGVTPLRILAIANFVAICTGPITVSLIGLGENRLVFYIMLYQTVVNILLDIILIPTYGATGAALATAFAVVTNNTIGVAALYFRFGVHPVAHATLRSIIAVGMITAVVFGVVFTAGLPYMTVVPIVGVFYPLIAIRLAVEPADEEILRLIEKKTNTDLTVVWKVIQTLK